VRRDRGGWRAELEAEAALEWAVLRQRVDVRGRRIWPQLLAAHLAGAAEGQLAGELLGPDARFHPDAVWIAAALRACRAGALLLRHALTGGRPDWTGGGAGLRPVLVPAARGLLASEPLVVFGQWGDGRLAELERHGRVAAVRVRRRRRGCGLGLHAGEAEGAELSAVEASWCPLSDGEARGRAARAEWSAWRAGLVELAERCAAFRAQGRMRMAVLPPAVAAEPWAEGAAVRARAERANGVLCAEARAAFAADAAAGLAPAELAQRYGLSGRQARNLKHRMMGLDRVS